MRMLLLVFTAASVLTPTATSAERLRVLFLGDQGGHRPAVRFPELAVPFAERGIELQYTERVADLNRETLSKFDALILYANIDRIEKPQEEALLEYVAAGGGFVPLHCATYCFRNSPPVVALMGGQFQRHGAGVFRTEISPTEHPVLRGFAGFESWDETYVHHLHNEANRTVLAHRADGEGREPYTWIRTHGEGRVFYTAWGHDHRTWRNPGFHNLVERGVRWAAGSDVSIVPDYQTDQPFPLPEMTSRRADMAPLQYIDVGDKIPNYKPAKPGGPPGEHLSQMQRPLDPSESVKHMIVPRGFHVELFASEPDFKGKPICMAWDERGRLWVGETSDYPNELQGPGSGHDRIRICEDTDGDGRADRFTVFAENLSLPTAIAFAHGGIVAQVGTQTLFLEDTDGDDVADQQQVLFTPWNMDDTHAGVSNFQYGLDNWIWAIQGYNHSRPEWDGNKHPGFGGGFFRFQPDGSQLEFIRSTNNNTWGLGITEEGFIFGSTANGNPSVFMPIANRYYERVRGWTALLQLGTIADTHLFQPITDRVRQVDHFGGYTAGAGHAIYTARSYPPQYWNRTALVCGPTGHLVGTFIIKPDGGNYRSTSPCNLLASDDEWTAPIMAEVGPDGSVWVIDWYNFIVQHNPTPQGFETGAGRAYESELRDKTRGRVYRVVYDGATNESRKSLAGATPVELVAALADTNFLWRRHAQRLLVERAKPDVADKLIALTQNEQLDAVGLNVGAIHALWTLQGLGLLDGNHAAPAAAAVTALKHPSSGVRINALRVLPHDSGFVNAVLRSGTLRDTNSQVRLAALLALADLPATSAAAEEIVRQFAAAADDRFMTDAVIAAAATNDVAFLPAALASGNENTTLVGALEIVAEHYARGEQRQAVAPLIDALNAATPRLASAVITGLARGWPAGARPALPPNYGAQLVALAERLDSSSLGPLIKLSRVWGSKRLAPFADRLSAELLAKVDDASATDAARLEAVTQIVDLAGDDRTTTEQLLRRITTQTPPQLATGIIESLAASTAGGVGNALIDKVPALAPAARRAAITVLLGRHESTEALLAGIDQRTLLVTELTLSQRRALTEHPNSEIRQRAAALLERRGVFPSADRQRVLDELTPILQQSGDAALGKQVFKKHCANCHMHTGEGTRIGPDLTGFAVHPKQELLTHIIDPSRSVEGNFRLYTVVTADGRTLAGMLAAESKTSIEIVDVQGKKISVLREDVDQLVASPKSMMPDGFEKQIPPEEMRNLLEFLTQRGQFVPLDLRQVATISSARGMFDDRQAREQRLIFPDWTPKSFQGVPFQILDPGEGDFANVILLFGPNGSITKEMPRRARVAVNGPAKAIHLLSGVSGWGYTGGDATESLTMTVRLIYDDDVSEDHPLYDGIHFADYVRRVDVPKSQFAFALRGQQIRYLAIHPQRSVAIRDLEFIKGDDNTAPVVMAVTLETLGSE